MKYLLLTILTIAIISSSSFAFSEERLTGGNPNLQDEDKEADRVVGDPSSGETFSDTVQYDIDTGIQGQQVFIGSDFLVINSDGDYYGIYKDFKVNNGVNTGYYTFTIKSLKTSFSVNSFLDRLYSSTTFDSIILFYTDGSQSPETLNNCKILEMSYQTVQETNKFVFDVFCW